MTYNKTPQISPIGHLPSSCKMALDRFKFRQDLVLNYLLMAIKKYKIDQVTIFADLIGWRTNGGTDTRLGDNRQN